MRYLLDANTYIQAKNEYYHMDVCPGYWNWLDHQFESGSVASISLVYDELKGFGDELSAWVKERKTQFLDISDDRTQAKFAEIAQHVATIKGLKPGNLEDFLGGADPWLIAKAQTIGATVVTHEALAPIASRKIKIPNICNKFGVD